MASETEVIDAIVDHVQESYDLALEAEGVDEETREAVHQTVGDAVGNNFDVLADELDALE